MNSTFTGSNIAWEIMTIHIITVNTAIMNTIIPQRPIMPEMNLAPAAAAKNTKNAAGWRPFTER